MRQRSRGSSASAASSPARDIAEQRERRVVLVTFLTRSARSAIARALKCACTRRALTIGQQVSISILRGVRQAGHRHSDDVVRTAERQALVLRRTVACMGKRNCQARRARTAPRRATATYKRSTRRTDPMSPCRVRPVGDWRVQERVRLQHSVPVHRSEGHSVNTNSAHRNDAAERVVMSHRVAAGARERRATPAQIARVAHDRSAPRMTESTWLESPRCRTRRPPERE